MTGIIALPHCIKFIFARFVDKVYLKKWSYVGIIISFTLLWSISLLY